MYPTYCDVKAPIWDINDGRLPQVSKTDEFQQWTDGHVRYVYAKSCEDARRHTSNWAMRNTNNHNIHILKKSCLGVLQCNVRCVVQSSGSSRRVCLKPAICDKARRKQIGKSCPNTKCSGKLELQPCRGHCGYPVTHFWREMNGCIYFQAKGVHDHARPESKLCGDTRRHLLNKERQKKRQRSATSWELDPDIALHKRAKEESSRCTCPPYEHYCGKKSHATLTHGNSMPPNVVVGNCGNITSPWDVAAFHHSYENIIGYNRSPTMFCYNTSPNLLSIVNRATENLLNGPDEILHKKLASSQMRNNGKSPDPCYIKMEPGYVSPANSYQSTSSTGNNSEIQWNAEFLTTPLLPLSCRTNTTGPMFDFSAQVQQDTYPDFNSPSDFLKLNTPVPKNIDHTSVKTELKDRTSAANSPINVDDIDDDVFVDYPTPYVSSAPTSESSAARNITTTAATTRSPTLTQLQPAPSSALRLPTFTERLPTFTDFNLDSPFNKAFLSGNYSPFDFNKTKAYFDYANFNVDAVPPYTPSYHTLPYSAGPQATSLPVPVVGAPSNTNPNINITFTYNNH